MLFLTEPEAAHDWAMSYNDNSIQSGREYGSTIYEITRRDGNYYSYTKPRVGGREGVNPSPPDR